MPANNRYVDETHLVNAIFLYSRVTALNHQIQMVIILT